MCPSTRTSTSTRTTSSTIPRIEFIILLARNFMKRTTDISEEILKRTFEPGIREKLIEKIHVYGIDDEECCRTQLIFEIDWKEHKYQITLGKENIEIGMKNKKKSRVVELDYFVRFFNDYCQSKNLKKIWQVEYTPYRDKEYARKRLGLQNAYSPTWYGKKEGEMVRIEEVPEIKLNLYLAGKKNGT